MTKKQTVVKNWWFIASGFVYTLLIFARDWKAIDRIGADTGYTYVPDAVRENLWVVFKPFPEYFEISGRAAAEIVALFPIRYHAIASSTVVNLIWVALGLFIYAMVFQESKNQVVSFLAGLVLIVTPHANESSIGNIGMIKFPLTAAVAVAFCSSRAISKFPKLIAIVALVAGLSQPILFVTTLPLLWLAKSPDRELRRKVLSLLMVVYGSFIIQVLKVGLSTAIQGRSGSSVKSLWPGMGLFWYSGIFFPTLFALFVIAVNTIKPIRNTKFSQIRIFLCASTIALAVSCFILGGIADRYFVAPMTLAWITGILFLVDFVDIFQKIKKLTIAIAFVFAIVPVVHWFEAGWFLTSGPTWTSEVDRATEFCRDHPDSEVELLVSPWGYSETYCWQVLNK
jgi:hypothetical protein